MGKDKLTHKKFKESINTLLPDYIALIVLASSVTYAFLTYMMCSPNLFTLFIISIIALSVSYLIFYDIKTFSISLAFFILIIITIITKQPKFLYSIFEPLGDFFDWLIYAIIRAQVFIFAQRRVGFTILMIIVLTMLYYCFIIKFRRHIYISALLTLGAYIYWNTTEIFDINKKRIIISFFFTLFAFLYFYLSRRYRIITINNDFIQNNIKAITWHRYITPFIAIVLALTILIMPNNVNADLRNEFIQYYLDIIKDKLMESPDKPQLGVDNKFSLDYTGFSKEDNAILGGPVRLSDKHVFDVITNSEVYLRGAVYDTYTGTGWTSSLPDKGISYNNKNDSIYRRIFNFDDIYNNYNYSSYFRAKSITLYNIHINTDTLFNSTYTTSVSHNLNDANLYFNDRTEMFFDKSIKGKEYTIAYLEPAVENPLLISCLYGIRDTNITRREITDYYLQLPDNFPERVRSLAYDITSDTESLYEKCTRIKDYLRNNYRYELNVNYPRKDVDFTENFLFYEKEGYCTYYATTMAVMCRSIGVPARYVTGFRAKPGNDSNSASVYNYNAHAWTEIYFEDIGWLVFDAVSSADFNNNVNYVINEISSPDINNEPTPNNPLPTEPKETETPEPSITNEPTPTEQNTKEPDIITDPPETPTPKNTTLLIILIGFIGTAFLIALLLFAIKKIRYKRSLSPKDVLIEKFNKQLLILKDLNISHEAGETLNNFFTKVIYELSKIEESIWEKIRNSELLNYKVDVVAKIYEKGLYSNLELTDEDFKYIDNFTARLSMDREKYTDYLNLIKKIDI